MTQPIVINESNKLLGANVYKKLSSLYFTNEFGLYFWKQYIWFSCPTKYKSRSDISNVLHF